MTHPQSSALRGCKPLEALPSLTTGQQKTDRLDRIRAVLDETPLSATINNPDVPSDFAYDIFYKTSPGTYSFIYTDHNGLAHPQAGEYSFVEVIKDIGQEGGIFTDGEDGDNVYIDLWLLSTGAVIENNNYFTVASSADYPDQ